MSSLIVMAISHYVRSTYPRTLAHREPDGRRCGAEFLSGLLLDPVSGTYTNRRSAHKPPDLTLVCIHTIIPGFRLADFLFWGEWRG